MTKFSDLKLDPKVLKAVEEAGYETPTPIQEGAIPHALDGRDVLGIAQTGTGKTASFTLPMITLLKRGRARARMPRSLVLAPTRELAAQVAENFDTYSKHTKLTKALLIGGVSFKEQDKLIDQGVDVLIATPGRLLDHFERGKLLLTGVQIMVVDEADRMLDMGFIPDIERIFNLTPFTRQTLFFSATMAPEIERITNTFLSNPAKIEVARAATTSDTIEQALIYHRPKRKDMAAKDKREILRAVIEAEGEACTNAIIFCNRKSEVDVVAKSLKKHGYNAEPIHGDLDQSRRMEVLAGFRDGSIRFLVGSDVAARGLDIPNVSHVFNFDVPGHAEDYVHRIGRTGRAGRKGKSFTIATPADDKLIAAVESLVEMTIPRAESPWAPPGGAAADSSDATPDEGEKREGRSTSRSRSRTRSSSARKSRDEAATAERPDAAADAQDADDSAARQKSEAAAARKSDSRKRDDQSAPAEGKTEKRKTDERKTDERKTGRRKSETRKTDENKPDERAQPARSGRGGAGQNDRSRQDNRHQDGVVGMGDHVPDFITKSFIDRKAS
ncbi:DEAD/DEAH box helicase [Brevirhabdus sp.]|uniref:DEAD/DEAH box helicase n=1 Tax=Brevirhabdus sp. TaxID=2004514 RepID=UPI00405850A8